MSKPIYLDYNATTPLDPQVYEAMKASQKEEFGNPSSANHAYGWAADANVKKAREQVASCIGAKPKEIIFTSGATESNNLAILGVLKNCCHPGQPAHVITTKAEHKAVIEVCDMAKEFGGEVTFLDVNKYGQVEPEAVEKAIKPNTKLISAMFANNEIGSINPVGAIAEIAQKHKIYFHTDGAQAIGKLPISVDDIGIDLMSISGHKIYGPKGVGALYVRSENPKVELKPIMAGGSQEGGLRPGTLNVAGIVGLGKACELSCQSRARESERILALRDKIIRVISEEVPEAILNGHPTDRLYNNVSFSFKGLNADMFALGLSGLAVSSGSACTSGATSHVLKAMGYPDELARATLRIGLGRFTTEEDVEVCLSKVLKMVEKNRKISVL